MFTILSGSATELASDKLNSSSYLATGRPEQRWLFSFRTHCSLVIAMADKANRSTRLDPGEATSGLPAPELDRVRHLIGLLLCFFVKEESCELTNLARSLC